VRVTEHNRVVGYAPGDTGEIVRLLLDTRTGEIYYAVLMDKNPRKAPAVLFLASDIEPDL
jgi:hypothetical protein